MFRIGVRVRQLRDRQCQRGDKAAAGGCIQERGFHGWIGVLPREWGKQVVDDHRGRKDATANDRMSRSDREPPKQATVPTDAVRAAREGAAWCPESVHMI